jgi:hypothetical protein
LIWFLDGDWDLPVAGILLAVLLAVVVGLAIVVLLPLLLFIGELVLVLAGVALLRGTWMVEAKTDGPPPASKAWKVPGWARSKRAVEEVASELRAGVEAAPAEAESV